MRLAAFVIAAAAPALLALAATPVTAQDAAADLPPGIQFAGTHPPDPEAIAVALAYAEADQGYDSIAERDAARANLVSEGYFYHGLDGHPIDFTGLGERQTSNDMQDASERVTFDVTVHQYENTMLVTYKSWDVRMDRGAMRERLGSALMVLTRTDDGWKVASDFLGLQPIDEHVSPEVLAMREAWLAEHGGE
ncbi:hypothetical protein [Aurantiacibacter hainanensis]|uniref:hypothetical protein n=1 Tax=Aurantiacibacter hainanensis TaxID=3076114 RepID=UPI0030C6F9E7